MLEHIKNICMIIIGLFFTISGVVFGAYLFEKKKEKGMIIFTGIMFGLAICLMVLFLIVDFNTKQTIGSWA